MARTFGCSYVTVTSLMRRKEGRKEMFYVLFNDALNIFYLRLYGVRHMVKDHSDSEKKTRCRHIGYSFRLTARILLYAPSHRQDSTYHDLCYTIVKHWLEREIAQWVHPMKDRSDDPSLLPQSYISLYRRRENAAWGPVYACLALAESLPWQWLPSVPYPRLIRLDRVS